MNFQRGVRRKYFEIAERVTAIETVSIQPDVEISGLREPELLAIGAELDGCEFDSDVLASEPDFFDGLQQIGFEAEHPKRAGVDLYAAGGAASGEGPHWPPEGGTAFRICSCILRTRSAVAPSGASLR